MLKRTVARTFNDGVKSKAVINKAASQLLSDNLSFRELMFQPFWSTSQETILLKELYALQYGALVITSFSGCRKSFTAQRVADRLKFYHPAMGLWPFFVQVVYIPDLKRYNLHFDRFEEPFYYRFRYTVIQLALSTVGVIVCGVASYLVSVRVHGKSPSLSQLWERVRSLAPGQDERFALLVMLLAAGARAFRKKIYVVDEVLKMKRFPCMTSCRSKAAQMTLDSLKSRAERRHQRVAILSSNEEIGELFGVSNNGPTHSKWMFPRASDEEMVLTLQRTKLNITAAEFENAKQLYEGMPHHLYSVRWWQIAAQHLPQIPRAALFTISTELDLNCQAIERHFALAYSREVDVATTLKNIFTDEEVAAIVRAYGSKGPRRLVLAAGLLITGRDARLLGELMIEEKVVAASAATRRKKSLKANKQALQEAKMRLRCFKEYIEKHHPVKACDPAVAIAETLFRNAVERAIAPNVDMFEADEKCLEEIGRIKALLH